MNKSVSPLEVGKVYLLAELDKIFPGENCQKELEKNIDNLSEKDLWRLLEAMSFTYRLNGIFWYVSDGSFTWTEEEVDCSTLTLTGINSDIDKLTSSQKVQNNAVKFRDYLISYFKKHPNDDPEKLGQFRPQGIPIKFPTIIVMEDRGKLKILDGSNRLMAHLLNGGTKIKAIVGRKIKKGKRRLGDSTFWLLRWAYQNSEEKDKEAILQTIKRLRDLSSDGKEAIKTYWIDYVRDEKLKKAGKSLLK